MNGGAPVSIAIGDTNGDGKPDLLVGSEFAHLVGVLLNNNGAPTTTTSLASSVNPVLLRQVVTYTATVAQSGGALSGTVTFADGFTSVATVTLENNQASYTTSYKTGGSHPITASYSGVLHTAEGSQSVTLTEYAVVVSKTVLATSGSPSLVGKAVTFTATVSSNYGTIPDGELVKFYDGTTLLGSMPLASENATFTTSKLSGGKTHAMKAIYVGDTKFASSAGQVAQVVNLYATTTTLTSSPNPSNFGQTVTMTATVKSAGPHIPTGRVVFHDGTTWIGAATLSAGVAAIAKSNLAVGTHSITATYSGDSMSAKSTSLVLNQVVQ